MGDIHTQVMVSARVVNWSNYATFCSTSNIKLTMFCIYGIFLLKYDFYKCIILYFTHIYKEIAE